jgi:large-conductance mechanosensitive channel
LAFLPPSFILITGFLVGKVYTAKYEAGTWKPYLRLASRGMKLFLVFAFLNVVHCVLIKRDLAAGVGEFIARDKAVFISGNGRMAIFEVLLPIAYFLLLAPILLRLRACAGGSILFTAAAIFLLCLCLEATGRQIKNLEFLSVGVIGMAFGLIPMQMIDRLVKKWFQILLLYLLYRVCSHVFGEIYPVQTLAATVSVLVLYCCALHLNTDTWLRRQMVVLGRYSLFAYLVQIAILQGLVKVLGGRPDYLIGVVVVFVITAILSFLMVKAVDEFRQRSHVVAAIYKAVFA